MQEILPESSLSELIDKSKIQELRHRYWYAILDKDANLLASLFSDDILLEYGFGIELNGRQQALEFFTGFLGNPELILQVPRGANGIVEIIDHSKAKGRWLVEVVAIKKDNPVATQVSVQYFEEYEKHAGEWRFARIKNDYLYFASVNLRDGP